MGLAGENVRARGAQGAGFDMRSALRAIARPRLTGSEGAAEVTAHVRQALSDLGYAVQDHDFEFNAVPGRFGITAVGAVYTIGSFAAAALLYNDYPYMAFALLLVILIFAGLVAAYARPLMEGVKWGRTQGRNLLATRPGPRPKYLVVAHRDSKSQPVPLSFRGPAIGFALIAWGVLLALAIGGMAQTPAASLIVGAGVVAFIAGVILIFCWVENNSPGALDNASGVAALLGIAAHEREAADVGFLITDGEELGLAGAHAIAGRLPPVIGAINLDGIDDRGTFHLVERFGWPRKRGQAPHLAAALLTAADELGFDARRKDVPFGIMLDHMPLVNGGTPALSILRGDLASLRRVHRPGDDLDALRGDGLEPAVQLVTRALAILRSREPGAP